MPVTQHVFAGWLTPSPFSGTHQNLRFFLSTNLLTLFPPEETLLYLGGQWEGSWRALPCIFMDDSHASAFVRVLPVSRKPGLLKLKGHQRPLFLWVFPLPKAVSWAAQVGKSHLQHTVQWQVHVSHRCKPQMYISFNFLVASFKNVRRNR